MARIRRIRRQGLVPLSLALLLGTFGTAPAFAEVTLLKTDNIEVYTGGRVNGFFSYGFGDAFPTPLKLYSPDETVRPAPGGFSPGVDTIPATGPDGMIVEGKQGTFKSMRVRSGFLPNVLGIGMRSHVTQNTLLTVYISIWSTIESEALRKTSPVYPDAREGYAQVEGPWGKVLVGRALDLFSRGATLNDFLYGHGYALGYPGNIDNKGPTAGLIGFGVLAAFFSPGIVYSTPVLAGLQLNVGVYDPTPLPGGWETTRTARPESELTFDWGARSTKLHLFANGAVQQLFRPAATPTTTMYGAGYGGRLEVGLFHLGVAGHYGKGLGVGYALEDSSATVAQDYALRTFDGYSAFAQFVLGHFDLNAGWGISRVFLLDEDKGVTDSSFIKSQTGYSAVVVYHVTERLHFAVDYMHGDFKWYLGEKQSVNFLSTGMTATW